MIQTNGAASDAGVSKSYSNTTAFLFPFGIDSSNVYYYVPATIQYSSAPSTYGTVTTRPVASGHPQAQDPTNALACYWKTTSTGFSGGSVTQSYMYTQNFVRGAEASYEAAYFSSPSWTTNGGSINTTSNVISFTGMNLSDGDFTAGASSAFGIVPILYSIANSDWRTVGTWSTTRGGSSSGTIPHATTIVYVCNGYTVTTTGPDTSGSLIIEPSATLYLQTGLPGNSFGAVSIDSSSGGTLRIDSSGYFPKGDWASFLGNSGGTVEYRQNGTATINLPTSYVLPSGSTVNITGYCNLITSPYGGGNINLPNTNLTVFKNFTVGYSPTGGTSSCTTRLDTAATTMTLEVKGLLTINQYGILQYPNGSAQNVQADSDLNILSGGTLKVRYGGTSVANMLTVDGNIVNNGVLDLDSNTTTTGNTYYCTLQFAGTSSKSLSGTTATRTHLDSIVVNKGTTLSPIVDVSIDTTGFQMGNGGLSLQNGTFRLTSPATMGLSSGAFTIPVTGGLSANGGTFNIVTGSAIGEPGIEGPTGNSRRIRQCWPNMSAVSSSISYSAAGSPTINISGGALNVYSQIRRDTTNNSGSLNYIQTGGTVTIGGKNPVSLLHSNYRAALKL